MNKRRILFSILSVSILMLFLITACGDTDGVSNEEPPETLPKEQDPKQEDEISEQTDIDEEIVEMESLSANPQAIEFSASDGTLLRGIFYPASVPDAPLIILMHWAPGDQNDWIEIAYWLQNRGLSGSSDFSVNTPWLDSSWFPSVGGDQTFNIFTFTFRNCENGCSSFERDKWYQDVEAAVDQAIQLEGVDLGRIVMIGASIGSDGAADGCAYLNNQYPGTCLGAISLSPGNYLTIDFEETVQALSPTPVWCLYAETDIESAPICGAIEQSNFTSYAYPADMIFSNGHGMNLIEQNQDPNPLDLIIQFLENVF